MGEGAPVLHRGFRYVGTEAHYRLGRGQGARVGESLSAGERDGRNWRRCCSIDALRIKDMRKDMRDGGRPAHSLKTLPFPSVYSSPLDDSPLLLSENTTGNYLLLLEQTSDETGLVSNALNPNSMRLS